MTTRAEFYYSESRKQYRKRIDGKDIWAKSKDALRARIRELENAKESGLLLDDTTTVIEYAAEWAPIVTAQLTPSGKAGYAYAINQYICPYFKDTKVKDVKPLHIDHFIQTLSHLSKASQVKILRVLKQMFKSAIENGLLSKNPCEGKKAGGNLPAEKIPLTKDQQQVLLDAVYGTRAYVFVALGLYAGLRREEILGLAWDDVHLQSKTPYISVTHAVHYDKTHAIRSPMLKSRAARRDIPIPSILYYILCAQKASNHCALVVPDTQGNVCSLTAYQNIWSLVTRRTAKDTTQEKDIRSCETPIDFYVTPHILRHTYITTLCASGMDIKKIQYLAGHKSASMTLQIYAHVIDNRPAELLPMLESVFA